MLSHRQWRALLALPALALPLLGVPAAKCHAQDPNPDSGGPAMILPDHANALYHVGDSITFTITWPAGTAPSSATYILNYGALTRVATGPVTISGNTATVSGGRFTKPGSLMLEVDWKSANGMPLKAFGGGIANPDDLRPGAPPPAGFNTFWAARLKELLAVPMNPRLTPEPSGVNGVSYSKITLDNIRGTHVDGQIARPIKGKKFPAIIQFQYAGVYGLQKSWVTDFAKQGFLAMNIEAHDIPIDKPAKYYQQLQSGPLKNYWNIGNDDPNKSYYLRMYLGCYRSIEYLKHRPDWNGKVLAVTGQSQGGQQAIIAAAMHSRDVTAVLVNVPAACDEMAPAVGRNSGFPNWYFNTAGKDPARVRQAGRYYDPANFAPMIRCPVLVGIPMRDEHLSPPDSIFATINLIKSPKDVIVMTKAGHEPRGDSQMPFYSAMYGRWLPALVQGKKPPQ